MRALPRRVPSPPTATRCAGTRPVEPGEGAFATAAVVLPSPRSEGRRAGDEGYAWGVVPGYEERRLLLNPDVGQIDAPRAWLEVLQTIAVARSRLAKVHHGNREVLVDQVCRLDHQFAASLLVECPLGFVIQLVDPLVAIPNHVEAALVLVATEHGVLDEGGVPAKSEQGHIEVVVSGDGLGERCEFDCPRRHGDADGPPGILHIRDQLVDGRGTGTVDHLEGQRLPILFDNA